jgi:hypothetical protein
VNVFCPYLGLSDINIWTVNQILLNFFKFHKIKSPAVSRAFELIAYCLPLFPLPNQHKRRPGMGTRILLSGIQLSLPQGFGFVVLSQVLVESSHQIGGGLIFHLPQGR